MVKIFRHFCFWLVCALIALTSPHAILATEDFNTELTSTYVVDDVGNTVVTHAITITNKSPAKFIKQYALKTTATELRNVVVEYNKKPLPSHVVATDQGTSIAIDFPDDVVGEGKARVFAISYTNSDVATIGGRVLELHIPKSGDDASFDTQRVHISTPIKFGLPVRTTPVPTSTTIEGNVVAISYDDAHGAPISLLFGREQSYKATIRYHLENKSNSAGLAQIALPPDTRFQLVAYESIEPQPESLKHDSDGNWIATYKVPAKNVVSVDVFVTVKVTLEPNTTPVIQPLPDHLNQQEYWESRHHAIKDIAKDLKQPLDVYSFVTKTLTYSTDPLADARRRLGAAQSLNEKDAAVCQEFTDLFVTLSRAIGIPARRLTGYAYTQNEKTQPASLEGDILHAWPEYFNAEKQMWVQVDPTWGVTTGGIDYFSQFDLSHIVFAINGVSSTSPFAAGFYKTADFNTKDIDVTFADGFPDVSPDLSVAFIPQTLFGVPVPGLYTARIKNLTGRALYSTTLVVQSDLTEESNIDIQHAIPTLLPFQTLEIPLATFTKTWHFPKKTAATATIQDETGQTYYVSEKFNLIAAPPAFGYINNPSIILGLGIGIAFTTLAAGSVLVFRRKK